MNDTPVIWALVDERPGTGSQCNAVAKAINLPYVEKKLHWSSFAKLPNFLTGASLRGISAESKSEIKSPWPDLVIAAGRRAGAVARYIKKQSLDDCAVVQLMYPGDTAISDFDLVAVPTHDGSVKEGRNIFRVTGAPHGINEASLSAARVRWHSKFGGLEKPVVGLIVGGATKRRPFSAEMAKELGRQTAELATKLSGSLIVTSSPRTGSALDDVLGGISAASVEPAFVYQWSAHSPESDNPYLGFLSISDHLVVTGESTTMCSEACATGKPVHLFAPRNFLGDKHRRFVDELVSEGYALELGADENAVEIDSPKKLDVAGQIAAEIHSRILSDLEIVDAEES
ncbi:MAG: mitochondrial fission ELM1 family protein [Rhodospirillales bacterium]|jgi:mitochondrial fission protein ELM1